MAVDIDNVPSPANDPAATLNAALRNIHHVDAASAVTDQYLQSIYTIDNTRVLLPLPVHASLLDLVCLTLAHVC